MERKQVKCLSAIVKGLFLYPSVVHSPSQDCGFVSSSCKEEESEMETQFERLPEQT